MTEAASTLIEAGEGGEEDGDCALTKAAINAVITLSLRDLRIASGSVMSRIPCGDGNQRPKSMLIAANVGASGVCVICISRGLQDSPPPPD